MNADDLSTGLPQDTAGEVAAEKPLYLQIVQALQHEIVAGLHPIGSALPSEAVLSQRFGVSRHTVREALRSLREAGLVVSRQGLGTIVRRPGEGRGYVHQVNTISDLFPDDVDTHYEIGAEGLSHLPQRLQDLMGSGGRWLHIAGTRTRPGKQSPFNELDVCVAERFARVGRLVGIQPGPIYGMIETLYGETIGEVEQVFGAFKSDGRIGRQLGLRRGDIGIEVCRVFRLAGSGEVAMGSVNRYLPEEFSFSMMLRRVVQ